MTSDVPLLKVPGDGGLPEGYNINEALIFKAYFCKFMCQSDWDNFYEEQVFLNDELKKSARASYNNETEKDFMEKIFDSDADYQQMTRFIINSLVDQRLLKRDVKPNGTIYWKTSKLKELCPEILKYILPVIDFLVDEYERSKNRNRNS